ncbi:MAG TPA: AAA family ATPase, partial [Yinghuangia sp.]|nr:AAA family ATPase [Yinghuangia sp.]
MEFDRRVQVRVHVTGADNTGFGSGYLVAPRLVLTAAHVLKRMAAPGGGATVTVSQPDVGAGQFPAIVRWWRNDHVVDAALIEVAETDAAGRPWPVPRSLADLLTRPPQRYGHLVGTRPHPVTLTGFPRMQKDPRDSRRLDEQLTGHIAPGTGALADRYEVSGTDPLPRAETAVGGTPWSGLSGAAVLADDGLGEDLLCGVIRHDRQATGGTRLTATRSADLIADDTFRALLIEHTGWEPVLEPAELADLLAPAIPGRDLDSPASLLRADAEAVRFHGRDSELGDLHAWCTADSAAISVRVLTGPGGQGKTRLARHLADTLGREGWATGHLRSDLNDHDTRTPDFTRLTTALALLLVVDYAETRPRLLRHLVTALHRTRHRVRLLLLARSDGPWRTDALNALPSVRRLLVEAPVTELSPLIPRSHPGEDRPTAFTAAARDLARLLPRVPTLPDHDWDGLAAALQPPDNLAHPRYDNVLTLQMTALVTLLQHGPAPADTAPGASIEEILLHHEERFWEDSAKTPAYKLGDLPTPTLGAAVAVAALCGAVDADQADAVLRTLPSLPDHAAPGTAAWVKGLYPAD